MGRPFLRYADVTTAPFDGMPVGHFLSIEASTAAGSVAIVADGALLAQVNVPVGVSRDDGMFPALQRVLADCALAPGDLAGVVCGAGPGSFTSLRIGAALAKGIAHGANVPLFAVPSLLLAAAHAADHVAPGEYLMHADALRGERYAQPVRIDMRRRVRAAGLMVRVAMSDIATCAVNRLRLAVGSSPAPGDEHAIVVPHASAVLRVCPWREFGPVSLDAWEPLYGRLAEAQVVWEHTHGHALPAR